MDLLIGASGTVGRHVRNAYRGRTDVRLLAHSTRSAEAGAADGFANIVVADLSNPATLAPAFYGVKRVFLLTPASPMQYELELNALRAAETAGVTRVVKLSLLYVGDAPSIRLKRPHEIVEAHLASSGLSYACVQPPAYVDNLLWQLEAIREGRIVYPGGTGRISHIDARDVAAVALLALTDDGLTGRLRITGPEALTYGELAERVSLLLGRSVTYVDAPAPTWRASAIASGFPEEVADTYVEAFAYYSSQPPLVDTALIERATGAPARRVDAFITETLRAAVGAEASPTAS